jgi:hypothetical protein
VSLSQDAWQGDARFTIKLDGVVLVADGVAHAKHGMGAPDVIELRPSLAAGPHSLVVSFTNDAWGGSAGTDRNLYVDAVSLNGVDLGQRAALYSNGDASFAFTKTAAAPPPTTDKLRIGLSADSWRGDPVFVVLVDGKQVGGERSVAASHAAGRVEFLELAVQRTPGPHELAVRFINDAWGGNALADRNLYVESVALNGVDLHGKAVLFSAGDAVFAF